MVRAALTTASAASGAAVAGTLGWPALAVMASPMIAMIGLTAWVLRDSDRANLAERLIRAWRGKSGR